MIASLFLFLTSCGFDLKSDLTRKERDAQSEIDTHDCGQELEANLRSFIALREYLTGQSPKCSSALDQLAQSQGDWLQQNPGLKNSVKPHEQQVGTPGFSGTTLAARMRHLNLTSDSYFVAESVAHGDFSGDVWAAHLGSVLHRSIFLAPGLTAFGYAKNSAATVLTAAVSARKGSFNPVFYPSATEEVSTARLLSERPTHDLAGVGLGFPISVHFPWNCRAVQVRRFTAQEAGRILPGKIYTKKELPKLSSSDVFLIASDVLPPGKTIDISADIDCGSQSFRKDWQFRTGD